MDPLSFLQLMLSKAKAELGHDVDLDEDEACIATLDNDALLLRCAIVVKEQITGGEHGEEASSNWVGAMRGINDSPCGCIIG